MDKNVSGVDLDELRKAREELDRERGVESDPNMYSDYNPNREEQMTDNSYENITNSSENSSNGSSEEGVLENVESNSETQENNVSSEETTNSNDVDFIDKKGESEQNLSKFSAFSAFEIKENATEKIEQPNPEPETKTDTSNNENIQQTESNDIDKKLESIDNSSELETMLNNILDIYDDEEEETETQEEVNNNQEHETNEPLIGVDIEPKFSEEETSVETSEAVDEKEEVAESVQEETSSQEKLVSGFSLDDLVNMARDAADNEKNEENTSVEESKEIEETQEVTKTQEPAEEANGTEVITDLSKLTEILQNELRETEEAGKEKIQESLEEIEEPEDNADKYLKYAKIEEFKFIDEISSEEFKNADKFSYILGKNENNELVLGNFREHYNLAIFGKNENSINSLLNSMILSLSLKNSYHAINFVLLDSNINSTFEVYNKSSYLYFNRIAKTNKEILDTLIEVSKEIDNRYEKIASWGVKNIDSYNDIAVENSIMPMPHILLVFNNYTSASEATDNDKINACLYQILKFGRIAGVYVVVTAKLPIEVNQVNYNLSSRISFKSDQDSRYTLGAKGAEELPDEDDALYYNISSNSLTHLKIATLSSTELDLIIKDLEE